MPYSIGPAAKKRFWKPRDAPPVYADPRAYAMFKLWLGQSLERNPLKKKSRDLAQAKALAALVQDKLPHLAKDWHQIRSFPADIAKQAMAQLAG
jgi:hypothetical protein